MGNCNKNCEVYSRIVGYFRPVNNWNVGKQEEFKDRKAYCEHKSLKSEIKSPDEGKVSEIQSKALEA